ncbi:hypothetical protein DP189_25305, partial [Enterobacter hormaechei subsp. xiangfangensis]
LAQTSVWEMRLQQTLQASKLEPKNPLLQALLISIFWVRTTTMDEFCVALVSQEPQAPEQ